MNSKTLLNTFPLALVRITGEGVLSYRLVILRIVAVGITFQEQGGMHLIFSAGVWRFEMAVMLEMWDQSRAEV